jgi:hypothetical protein
MFEKEKCVEFVNEEMRGSSNPLMLDVAGTVGSGPISADQSDAGAPAVLSRRAIGGGQGDVNAECDKCTAVQAGNQVKAGLRLSRQYGTA